MPAHLRKRAAAIPDSVLASMDVYDLGLWLAAKDDGDGDGGAPVTELTEFRPDRVDLVASPASGAPFLLVKARPGQPRPPRLPRGVAGAVVKSDEAQRYTLCLAYPADRPDVGTAADGHRDYASKAALEDAAWTYLTQSPKVGLWHEDGTEGAGDVVESYIYRGPEWKMTASDGSAQVVKSGDWLLGIRWSPETWPLVRDGHGRGVSMQGTARRRVPSAEELASVGKARRLERQAAVRADPVEAAGLRKAAGVLREQAAGRAGRLAKAREYERKAERASDPRDRSTYMELAAAERRKAGA